VSVKKESKKETVTLTEAWYVVNTSFHIHTETEDAQGIVPEGLFVSFRISD
jgi:hypothetical protein